MTEQSLGQLLRELTQQYPTDPVQREQLWLCICVGLGPPRPASAGDRFPARTP